MEELWYVLIKDLVSCVHVRYYFFTAADFHLTASISHFLNAAMKFSCFSSNEIRLPSSFSVIHEGVNIKNSVEKDTTLLAFFLSKSPGGHAIFFRCIWVAIPVDRVILYWCAREVDGRSTARAVYGHVITNFLGWVDLLSYRSPHARASSVWSSAIIIIRYTKKGL